MPSFPFRHLAGESTTPVPTWHNGVWSTSTRHLYGGRHEPGGLGFSIGRLADGASTDLHPSPCEAPNAIRGRSGGEGEVGGHGRPLPPRPLASPGFLAYAQSAVNPARNLPRSTRKEVKNMVHYRSVTQAVIAVAALCVLGMPNVSLAADKAEEGFVSLFRWQDPRRLASHERREVCRGGRRHQAR